MPGAQDGPPASPLLRGLSRDEESAVLSKAVSRRLRTGQVLFHEDDPAEALYLVQAGRLRLTQVTPAGQTVTVRFTGPGELCAALAVLDGKAYPFTATAVVPTTVVLWNRNALRDVFLAHPAVERNVLDVVGTHAREALDKFRELATEPVPRRLARTLLRLTRLGEKSGEGEVVIDGVRQRDLAEMAAISPYTVNRVLSDWEAHGILRRLRAGIVIRAPGQLRRIAEA